MANPQTVIRGNNDSTAEFQLAPGVFQYIQSVHVVIDNTAGADVRPTLTVETQDGVVMAAKRQGETLPAGDTGSATWALRLDDERNLTGFLHWGTNTDTAGQGLVLTGGGAFSFTTGGSAFDTDTGGGGYEVNTKGGGATFKSCAFAVLSTADGSASFDVTHTDGFAFEYSPAVGFGFMDLRTGQTFVFRDNAGNPILTLTG